MGYSLASGVETDAIWTIGRKVAKQGSLPATEAVVSNRYWQGYIYTDHADFYVISKISGRFTVSSEDTGTVAVFVGVDQIHCFLLGFNSDDCEYRAEDFILVYFHIRRHFVKQAAPEEVAVFMPFYNKVAAIN